MIRVISLDIFYFSNYHHHFSTFVLFGVFSGTLYLIFPYYIRSKWSISSRFQDLNWDPRVHFFQVITFTIKYPLINDGITWTWIKKYPFSLFHFLFYSAHCFPRRKIRLPPTKKKKKWDILRMTINCTWRWYYSSRALESV